MERLLKEFIDSRVAPVGELLYLSEFGSRLYGCDHDGSDYDFKGVFLPNKENVLCYEHPKSVSCKTKYNGVNVDIECWSLQHFLLHCLVKGDSNGIDLAYSITKSDSVIYYDGKLFDKYLTKDNLAKYVLNNKMKGLLGYIVRQCDVYGIKGERLKELREFKEFISKFEDDERLGAVINQFDVITKKYIFLTKTPDGSPAVNVLGRLQPFYLRIKILKENLDALDKTYGSRSNKALSGTDFKALSHAYRACLEIKSLYENKEIVFPLPEASYLLDIKLGKVDVEKVKSEIASMLTYLDSTAPFDRTKVNVKFLKSIIINYYIGD